MSAPVIEWLRPGVGYTPEAARSMRRLERDLGRPHDCNSSYRDWDKQMSMYRAWTAYENGTGPHPGHSRALHPDKSMHCKGLADDSDDWTVPGYIRLAEEHGWIRTAASDPTERHHFEYQRHRDQHFNEPAPAIAGGNASPFEEDDMPTVEEIRNAILDFDLPRQGQGQKGTTNLRQIVMWFDNAIVQLDANNARRVEELKQRIEEKANAIAQHVTRAVDGVQAGGAQIDPDLIRSAVTEAVEKALGGTTLDPQVTAKAVREEFRADPLS